MGDLVIKRIYDEPDAADGYRALVDRLWPRGVSKERARLDAWWKELSPSDELRVDWHHDPTRFDEFAARYRGELDERPFVAEALDAVRSHARVTLLYSAHDTEQNQAVVLRGYLAERVASS